MPIKNAVGSFIDKKVSVVTEEISDKLGLSITYKSLSPSLLTSFNLKGVKIYDHDGISVLDVDNIKINYNIFKLLKKDFRDGIKSVLVDGINLNINEVLKIASMFKKGDSKGNFSFAVIKNNIPKNIKLKNINFFYKQENLDLVYTIKKISLLNKSQNQALGVDVNSSLNAYLPILDKSVSCRLDMAGAITNNFENSQLNIKISDIVGGKVKINKLNFHANYINDVISLYSVQVTNPIAVGVSYNLETTDFTAQLNTDDITLDSLIASSPKKSIVRQLRDTTIGTATKFICNFKNKNISFSSKNNISLPQSFIDGGMDINFDIEGNEKHLGLTEFKINSLKCLADASLDFTYDNFNLSGIVQLPYFKLPNGNSISTEIYFDPLDKGFMGFSPQLFIGSKAFTALQFTLLPQEDSFDFMFEMSDYSHSEESVPGVIKIDGSYLTESKYFQTSVSLNTLYVDTVTSTYGEFLSPEKYRQMINLQKTVAPYVLSGDMYISTDLKSVSYNIPYVLLANTKKDNQVAMFAINGTEQSIQLNQFSLVFGKLGLQANALFDKNPDTSDIFFDVNITSSSIPYHFSGTIMPEICTIVGDYGINVELRFDEENIDGFVQIDALPFMLGNNSFIISTYTDLKYNPFDGPIITIDRFEAEGANASQAMNPRLSLSGSGTKYGVQLDSVAYTDFYSALEGRADLMLNMSNNIFAGANLNVELKNPLSPEKVKINGTVSNPDLVSLSGDNLVNNLYLDLQIDLNSFSLNRFASTQSDSNLATGSVFASGTIAHPYVTASLQNVGMYLGSSFFKITGNVLLEDRYLSLIGLNVGYGGFKFNNLQGEASLEDFTADFDCDFEMSMMNKVLKTPLNLSVNNSIIPVGSNIPDAFTATIKAKTVEGSLMKKKFPFELSIIHSPEGTNLISSDNIGLRGFLSSDGVLEANWDNREFMSAKLDGFITSDVFNIQLYDLYMDMEKAFNYINIDDLMSFERGILTGELFITGSLANPDMDGHLLIASPICRLPFITPQKVSAREIQFNIVDNVIEIPDILIKAKSGEEIKVGFNIYLNKFALDYIEGKAKTVGQDLFPGNLFMPFLNIEADVAVDLDMFIQNSIFEITGTIFGENAEATSGLSTLTNIKKTDSDIENSTSTGLMYKTDIDVTLGTHASMSFAPILRCVFVPNTKIKVIMDQSNGEYAIDGEVKLRSGDIAYLNRSFYIKSGAINFTDDIANPLVTLIAETREHDDNGDPVKIILEVQNQYLLELAPKFRAEPAKSEMEIQSILGQIVVADSDNPADFLFAASDYAFQSTFVRKVENKLRDLLNFDIFSIRTNVLQNTLSLGVSGNLTKENLSIGNFLDNSTVYIGKYLGSSLYLDAMLHVSFEDGDFKDITAPGKIIFQPEIGLEMESPFANIRFDLAPDINALLKNNQFVPSTSVTLSWDFTF